MPNPDLCRGSHVNFSKYILFFSSVSRHRGFICQGLVKMLTLFILFNTLIFQLIYRK